ncbi:MAG: hypothetical protein JNL58_10830 [Planctomyces sp.]|nr:hypothetical protein [Planctomyces sp.]
MPAKHSEQVTPTEEMTALRNEEPMSLSGEFAVFLRENRKWWMFPILIVLAVATIIIKLSSTGAAPLIYSFF